MANILVIDDDRDILRLLEVAMKRAGHEVAVTTDGQQGLIIAEDQHPDLIVADVMMPKVTGYEFCRQARVNPALAETPIIIYSARFQPIDRETAMQAGATDYLPKTTSPDALLKRITELLPASEAGARTGTGTIALFSLRGGSGVTCLSVNLAVALTRLRSDQPVLLLDLAPMGGHAALMLGLRPTSSVSHILAHSANGYTMGSIKPHLLRHESGVYLLPSPLSYEHQVLLADNRLPQLVTSLKKGAPVTILDLPPVLEPAHTALLRSFDKLVLVLSADVPSLQSAVLALQSLVRLGVSDSKIVLVLNQVVPQAMLPVEAVQKALKRPILLSVPYDSEMSKSVNQGKPLLLTAPQSPAAAAIARLAGQLLA